MVTIKLANNLLIHIYEEYKKENGEGIARLKFARFRVDDPKLIDFVKNNSDLDSEKEIKSLLSDLLLELHERGFIEKRNMVFTLSVRGVNQSKKLQHPVKYFIANQWIWYIPIVISSLIFILK